MKGKKIQIPEGYTLKELNKGLYEVVETPQKEFQDDDWVITYEHLPEAKQLILEGEITINKYINVDEVPWVKCYKIDLEQPLKTQLDKFLKLK